MPSELTRFSAVADEWHDGLRHACRVIDKGGPLSMIILRRSNWIDNTHDGRRAVA